MNLQPAKSGTAPLFVLEGENYYRHGLMHCEFCHRCVSCCRILRKWWPGRRYGHAYGCEKRGVRVDG